MSKKLKRSKQNASLSWDLSDLFSGLDDPKIESSLATMKVRAKAFANMYRGKIERMALVPRQCLKAIQEYEVIWQELAKPNAYAQLVFSIDTQNHAHGAFLQKMRLATREIENDLLFFELELARLDGPNVDRLRKDPSLAPYAYYLSQQFKWQAHRLGESEEKILGDKAVTGRSAFERLFEQEIGEIKNPGLETSLVKLYDSKGTVRKMGAKEVSDALRVRLPRISFIYNTLIQDKKTEDVYRKFSAPESSRHLVNDIEPSLVHTMIDSVTRHHHLVQDFYRFKKKVMGVKVLYDYDRYAPVGVPQGNVSFLEAKRIVLDAFRSFSPVYAAEAELFFDRRWIDVPMRLGKRGGAFCSYVTPDIHPYILLNFKGGTRDVLTLAHELGHGIHMRLSGAQTYLNFATPLTVAETASIFGEMLVFHSLKRSLKNDRERFGLYMGKLEQIFASVFRQTTMYQFEQDVHAAVRDYGEQSPEAIGKLWHARQQEMFGSSVKITPEYEMWWSYIIHFIESPFYVYAYAFGELLTLALYAKYQKEGPAMTEAYLNLLRAGGSATPQTLLRPFGIDLSDRAFWDGGLRLVAGMIDEAKQLYRSRA